MQYEKSQIAALAAVAGPRGRVLACAAAVLLATTTLAAAQDSRPDATRPVEAAMPMPDTANVAPLKVDDIKADEAKPQAAAPAEPARNDAAKVEAQKEAVVDAKPAEIKPAESASANATPVDSKPVDAKPVDAKIEARSESAAAPAAAPAATASATMASADQPVADQIKTLMGSKLSRYIDHKDERAGAEAFYAARQFAPIWTEGGQPTARAKAAVAYLRTIRAEGMFPEDYPTPDFAAATTPEALAEAELKFTDAVLTYARHAQTGRVAYSRVSADIAYPDHAPDYSDVLMNLAKASDVGAALAAYQPQHAGYKALKAKLAEMRGQSQTEPEVVHIADGKTLKPGAEDERVVQIRKRLNVVDDADSRKYDDKVVDAVKAFQKANGLNADGVVGAGTVRKLNGDKVTDNAEMTIIANMERWRWLPRTLGEPKLGDAFVILNIPDFTLKVMHQGKMAWTTRVVTGKPGKHATPMLTETMKYITVNPTWNVPPSIVYNEYLPALQQDPTVLQRMGLNLTQNRDGSIHISQPPGERNALGRIRFNFPNKFLVYQHDTPDKHLFAHESRAYSHGCMRVQNPDQYAEALLGIALPNEGYSAAKIRSMYGRSEQNINLPTPIPVHITYQTAFVDDAGKLQLRKDIYGRDAALIAQLKDGGRKGADVPVSHSQPSYGRPSVRLPQGVAVAGNSGWQNDGPSFFERLFGGGGGSAPMDPEPRRRRGPPR